MSESNPPPPRSGLAAVGRGTVGVGQQSAPPSGQSDLSDRGEPEWTTGQALGFLVALPGWVMVPTSLIGLAIAAGYGSGIAMAVCAASSVLSIALAIPGTIVMNKCERPGNRPGSPRRR